MAVTLANILSYLRWRGDLTFKENKFNEIDNLLLSVLAYYDLKDIVDKQEISLKEAYKIYEKKNRQVSGLILSIDNTLFKEMALSRRFGDAKLSYYTDILNQMTQFAAMKIKLDDDTYYITFRGTDDSLIGWKENFTMTYEITPAQQTAVQYLNEVIKSQDYIRLGGHSKGGNLAVFSAAMSKPSIRSQIKEIYSNDGPGLSFDLVPYERYQAIADKIIKFVPAFDVVGMLFEQPTNVRIIASSQKGLLQHSINSWLVEGTSICKKEIMEQDSLVCQSILKETLDYLSMTQRRQLVDELFDILKKNNCETLRDVSNLGIEKFITILHSLSSDSKDIIKKMTKIGLDDLKKNIIS